MVIRHMVIQLHNGFIELCDKLHITDVYYVIQHISTYFYQASSTHSLHVASFAQI